MHPEQRKIARVLFDEFHSESWSISEERAREMEPDRAANSSYHLAASVLQARDFLVARNLAQPLLPAVLAETDVLVLPHPCDARWERTTSPGSPALSEQEINAIQAFVRAGGGLLVITEYEHDKYGDNLNALLAPAGLRIENGTAFDRSACVHENAEWLLAEPSPGAPLVHGVGLACFYRTGWCTAEGEANIAWQTSARARPAHAGLIATAPLGAGRIVLVTDSVLFGDEHLKEYQHEQLWLNILYWLSVPKAAQYSAQRLAPPSPPDAWPQLKTAINQLRATQNPDGSVAPPEQSAAAPLVSEAIAALAALAPQFPHQAEYFAQVPRDFHAWMDAGFPHPDFGKSLAVFQPQQHRQDGREHLVLFPLYTPNASSDTRFEALIMRLPWPDWLAGMERNAYHNPKFVPGHLVDFTDGYASECAVLFPETVSLTGQPWNHFATIFCDREARRLQNCLRRAAGVVGLELFPKLEFWLGSLPLIEDTVALWDLIHDASHSMGELPFDPFMIRQRAPFWMYALEELRVDLRGFEEATRLAAEGFPFARYVTWAILLDRVLRFPITGSRVRNYDALGGQLLFAYLHQHDILVWRDNRLTIHWDALARGFHGLREELARLYKNAADSSKLSFWLAGHELISRYVRPNVASQWKAGESVINDERDLKRWLTLVHEDEFPLGNFHVNLQRKLA
ncbi:MAG: DUF6421 family protein [Chthoniobacter sp.]|uniref:DUF6421 family protein n=1 Tax=Chthoniobacter sp. TaxID=2510640 RepID=UPI0032A557AE